MTKVVFEAHSGESVTVDVPEGTSFMQAALQNDVAGIYAECGGQGQCATCHVYVSEPEIDVLPVPDEDEDEMLEATACDRLPNSRLACQLKSCDELSNVHLVLPEYQR